MKSTLVVVAVSTAGYLNVDIGTYVVIGMYVVTFVLDSIHLLAHIQFVSRIQITQGPDEYCICSYVIVRK
jgi:hypothetical protein